MALWSTYIFEIIVGPDVWLQFYGSSGPQGLAPPVRFRINLGPGSGPGSGGARARQYQHHPPCLGLPLGCGARVCARLKPQEAFNRLLL